MSGAQATFPARCTCTCQTFRTTRATSPRTRQWPCTAGWGTGPGIAASLLEQAGLKKIIHVNAPYEDWVTRLHLAETIPH